MNDEINSLKTSITKLFAQTSLSPDLLNMEECAKSGNNRTYKVKTKEGWFAVKHYFQQNADTRDRLNTEFSFLTYANKAAPDFVPKPFCYDLKKQLAIYEFKEGIPLQKNEITAKEIEQASDFFLALNKTSIKETAVNLADASEACFSITKHLHLITSRIHELQKTIAVEKDSNAEQLITKLAEHWLLLVEQIKTQAEISGLDYDNELTTEQRCISPSDFGFHNALKMSDGSLCFLDFEYAGWDDPGKMSGDFFSQLAIPVPSHFFQEFVECTMSAFPQEAQLIQRAYLLRPVYQIKWCCIALNIFLPRHLARRLFADPQLNVTALKQNQLRKTEQLMNTLLPLFY